MTNKLQQQEQLINEQNELVGSIVKEITKNKLERSFLKEFKSESEEHFSGEVARKEEVIIKWAKKVNMEETALKIVETNKQLRILKKEIMLEQL